MPCDILTAKTRRDRVIAFLIARDTPLRDTPECFYCKRELPPGLVTLDHVWPRSRGGSNSVDNLVISCARCNNLKGDSLPGEGGVKAVKREASRHQHMKCRVCRNGRQIPDEDDSCWACLRPNLRKKMSARSCHHVETWCVGCAA